MICYWEELAQRAAKHLQEGEAEHSQHLPYQELQTDMLLSANAALVHATNPCHLSDSDLKMAGQQADAK